MHVILLSGKQGSGKTTTVNALEVRLQAENLGVMRTRFAMPVYLAHDAVYAVLAPTGIVKATKKDGLLLQLLGDNWGRTKDPDIWVRYVQDYFRRLEETYKDHPTVKIVGLIEDLRYVNEYYAFPDDQSIRVRLEAPEAVRRERTDNWRPDTEHPSEVGLDDFAEEGSFDLIFDTSKTSTEEIVEEILALYRERAAIGSGSTC